MNSFLGLRVDPREALRFAVTGAISGAVYVGFLVLFTPLLSLAAASVPAYIVAILANYVIQRFWTFKSRQRHAVAIPRHVITHIGGIGLNAAIIFIFHARGQLPAVPVQAAALCVVAGWGYVLQKYWVFGTETSGR